MSEKAKVRIGHCGGCCADDCALLLTEQVAPHFTYCSGGWNEESDDGDIEPVHDLCPANLYPGVTEFEIVPAGMESENAALKARVKELEEIVDRNTDIARVNIVVAEGIAAENAALKQRVAELEGRELTIKRYADNGQISNISLMLRAKTCSICGGKIEYCDGFAFCACN